MIVRGCWRRNEQYCVGAPWPFIPLRCLLSSLKHKRMEAAPIAKNPNFSPPYELVSDICLQHRESEVAATDYCFGLVDVEGATQEPHLRHQPPEQSTWQAEAACDFVRYGYHLWADGMSSTNTAWRSCREASATVRSASCAWSFIWLFTGRWIPRIIASPP